MAAPSTDPRETARGLLTALELANWPPEDGRCAYEAALDDPVGGPRPARETLDCITKIARIALAKAAAASGTSFAAALDEVIDWLGTLDERWPPDVPA
jgi:hypothetical protein